MKRWFTFFLAMLLCTPALAEEAEPTYAELAARHGFKAGGCLSYSDMANVDYLLMLKDQFNSLTTTNEMKAYSLLDQRASQRSADGMPVMNYSRADKMVGWAQRAGLGVRGHVLVWDAYMCDWFFHEGYDSSQPIADRETLLKRLESYITQVVTHFETSFPGVVYCWDVVNEAVGDSAGEYMPDDPRHLRTMRSGAQNPFYYYVGPDYVELSFVYARNVVDQLGADIKLFYNDYNTFYPAKREAVCALIDSVNNYVKDENGQPRMLMDGLGMQGYIGGYGQQAGCMNADDLARIKTAIQTYAAKGVEVQLTEMAVRNYDKTKANEHVEFCIKLYKVFCSVNAGEERPLTAVTIWGLRDSPNEPKSSYSYKMNGPFCGLLDEKSQPKAEFYAVCDTMAELAQAE